MRARFVRTGALALAVSLGLTGCAGASEDLAAQYKAGGNNGFVSGNGTINEFAATTRTTPLPFSGTDETGRVVSSVSYQGRVVVLNFWYAGCAPCRAEAPLLSELANSLAPADGAVLGVNVRDTAETAASFNREFSIRYPSLLDAATGSVQLAFAGTVPANAVPTTIVLDRQGRVAARILGRIADKSIITSIVRDLITEPAAG